MFDSYDKFEFILFKNVLIKKIRDLVFLKDVLFKVYLGEILVIVGVEGNG